VEASVELSILCSKENKKEGWGYSCFLVIPQANIGYIVVEKHPHAGKSKAQLKVFVFW
jgi:hypothetical protein